MLKTLSVRGARAHNLKSVNVDIPRDSLTVVTGLSGSGKSSLAFDTIYAEGQRRYVESLSAYARQFLEMQQKPDVDHIEGLSPAISIEQKTTSKNPRSTVATVTEIYDYMRLLWARAGTPYSPATGEPIAAQTVSEMVDRALALGDGQRLYLLAPIVRDRKGEYRKEFKELRKKGFQRVKVDGRFYDIEDVPALDKKYKHDIDVVVDRVVVKAGLETRLADSFETALSLTDGLAAVETAPRDGDGEPERHLFSEKFACPVSGFTIPEIEPRLFSFNSPQGACPSCDGLGVKLYFDPELVIPDPALALKDGAVAPWSKTQAPYYRQTLQCLARHYGFAMETPWADLPETARRAILYGSDGEPVAMVYDDGRRTYTVERPFEGVIHNIERRWRETDSQMVRDDLARYQASATCEACAGHRLKPEALAVKLGDRRHIGAVSALSVRQALAWFRALPDQLSDQKRAIADRILKEIIDRLGFLNDVGLDYLTLARSSATLSGGESQRIRLASQIGSGLTGVLYVLDEPSIGLHQRDNDRLLETLKNLRDLGNTVLVVEHDEDAIRTADHIIDMGPGAGEHGGEVVVEGTLDTVLGHDASLTGQYLSGRRAVAVPAERRRGKTVGKSRRRQMLRVEGASANNLADVDVAIPLGTLTCVTGVSGSGKSTLINETLYKAVARQLNKARVQPGAHRALKGLDQIDKVVDIDQSPIGRTPRSNPATYTGAFTPIRDWFAGLPEAQARGYKPGRFSFNVKGGRCEACQGDGLLKIEMHFLPDVYVTCDVCKGARYNRETLDIKFKDRSIADVLDMTVEDGVELFKAVPAVRDRLAMLARVGLGYVRIGQAATTLSGGEAQRVKLAKELAKRSTGKTLYVLDEPTTGLHFEDVRNLMGVLQALVDQGNTVVVIEHNLEVIKCADWIVDLGPDGGDGGGRIVATGTPEQVAETPESHTGRYLKPILAAARTRAAAE
ncbi:excinuclease ABC subunit A [Rhodothalassium salexigens DSM 2132]|uniref:UvrABC system protein A n=1 Tax=Rhodothalassium salexigens DSM 2132 TaxID=1188247 RepID=A0A4R2PUA5_RHOSA|nr:excinuclease ABC subunit UvrA [Rhodothalassium salexigens]MBB4210729.1 excinuclease ABC subunit A [Rhodothalassium salexigens DSM 2132]MBK1638290.1 excinuclease ABC subunit A [Rhodothalassium salexigens DSM 2132]TCP37715.1 excinuclease ABC subunit A [Rhodothalassium salexigens DSM 2132]